MSRIKGLGGRAHPGWWVRPLFILVLAFLATGCKPDTPTSGERAASERPALTVSVATATTKGMPHTVTATGTVMPWQELTIDAEASGLAVMDVRVKENDAVRAGDVLVRLDDRSLKAQLAQQRATVAQAQATLTSGRQEAARAESLVLQKAMSQETVETRRTAILTDQAKLDQATASLDQLQAQLDQTVVRAPAAGIVSADPIKLGTVTQAGTELVRIIRDGRLEVQARVPERDLARIRPGQAARVTGPDGSNAAGSVRDTATKLDAATRMGIAYVTLPGSANYRVGMFATAAIEFDRAKALVIAEGALVWPNGKPSVFVVGADNRVGLRAVTVADRVNGEAVIAEGVLSGDRVVITGAGFLHDGDKVRVEAAQERIAGR